jgi:hypothetical protein
MILKKFGSPVVSQTDNFAHGSTVAKLIFGQCPARFAFLTVYDRGVKPVESEKLLGDTSPTIF